VVNLFYVLLLVPVAAGLLGYLIGRLRNEFSFIGTVFNFYFAVRLFLRTRHDVVSLQLGEIARVPVFFRLDALSGFVLLFAAVFGVLIVLYSFRYMRGREGVRGYYLYALLALAGANGVLISGNLVTLLFFWGTLLVVLYGLLLAGKDGAEQAARKALVIVGLSDFAMLLGIVILLVSSGWIDLAPRAPMALSDPRLLAGFLLVAAGALAKAGSMPFHTWIPAAALTSPATTMALFPSAFDKLLGIYLLTRLSCYVFNIASNTALRVGFMALGALTVLGAVMMALVQKRAMRLLAFHSVSQVGYMVIGIGTGVPVGIAGGLFHMLNNSLYKTGLFLSAGTVEHWAKTDEIDKLGGLARQMPVTFISFLICALAIAGVPPLNGFASKWMVYQGVIEVWREGNWFFAVVLVAAMLGSVLTLASFLKLAHAMFFGQRPAALAKVREGGFTMWLPPLVLALLCVGFGVFAYQVPLRGLIYPSLPFPVEPFGIWQPVLTTLLLLVGLGLGALVYILGTGSKPIVGKTFVGGEKIADEEESRVPGTAFYSPVKSLPVIGELLHFGEAGAFDLYNWVKGLAGGLSAVFREAVDRVLDKGFVSVGALVRSAGQGLSYLSSGRLPVYVAWVFLGAALLLLLLVVR